MIHVKAMEIKNSVKVGYNKKTGKRTHLLVFSNCISKYNWQQDRQANVSLNSDKHTTLKTL